MVRVDVYRAEIFDGQENLFDNRPWTVTSNNKHYIWKHVKKAPHCRVYKNGKLVWSK